MRRAFCGTVAVLAAALSVSPSLAQEAGAPQSDADWLAYVPDPVSVDLPEISLSGDEETDQHFFFHREGTGFAAALSDLRECDGFSRNLSREGNTSIDHIVTAARRGGAAAGGGALGAPLGDALGAATARSIAKGPAERAELRKKYRINIRRCMFYKGYARFGLDQRSFDRLAFDPGEEGLNESQRQRSLIAQARLASATRPDGEELGL